MRDNGMMEAFRGDDLLFFVIPEIFNRESRFLLLLWFLKTVDPGLKIAGVTKKAIELFRGDEHGELSLRVIFYLFLLSFCVFVFQGVYEGALPPL